MRPILRYHGGKWKMAGTIIAHFPKHRVYVEPFGGAASVLLRKPRSYAEVYNDLDGEVVNLFRVVRQYPTRLARDLALTPFAREEYRESFECVDDPVEMARRTVIRSFMGFGSDAINRNVKSGFRANSNRSGTTPAHDWVNYPRNLWFLTRRLQGVIIENRPAIETIRQHDGLETLFYLDPPYVHSTRALNVMHGDHGYAHEMTDAAHEELADALSRIRGMAILSGYHSELYDRLYADWERIDFAALADGAAKRTESLWMNEAAVGGRAQKVMRFDEVPA